MRTVQFDEGEWQAICLALWKLRLERPGWENYLKMISDQITPGQYAVFEQMQIDGVTAQLER